MKKISVIFCILLCGILCGCSGSGDEKATESTPLHPTVIKGEIIEIVDNDTVIVEITDKHDSKLSIGDIVKINYKDLYIYNTNALSNATYNISQGQNSIQIGDEISASFFVEESKIVDDVRIVDIDEIEMFLDMDIISAECKILKVSTTEIEVEFTENIKGYTAGDKITFELITDSMKIQDGYTLNDGDTIEIGFFDYSKINSDLKDFLYTVSKN